MKDSDYDQVLLRWREGPSQTAREAHAAMLTMRLREAVVSCGLPFDEHTEVQIIAAGYRESGVIHSCHEEAGHFILSIWITSAPLLENSGFRRDPGVFAIEDFITEEEADKLLDELDRELGAEGDDSPAKRAFRHMLSTVRLMRLGTAISRICPPARAGSFCSSVMVK